MNAKCHLTQVKFFFEIMEVLKNIHSNGFISGLFVNTMWLVDIYKCSAMGDAAKVTSGKSENYGLFSALKFTRVNSLISCC